MSLTILTKISLIYVLHGSNSSLHRSVDLSLNFLDLLAWKKTGWLKWASYNNLRHTWRKIQWLIWDNVTEDHFVTMVSEVEGKIKILKKTFSKQKWLILIMLCICFRNSLFHYLRAGVVSKSNHTKNSKDIFATQASSICQEIFSL